LSRFHSYINSAQHILGAYKGTEPFPSFLKKYFAQHKKFGSRDRKQVSHLCYCYFRLGRSLPETNLEDRLLAGLFLCSEGPADLVTELRPGWQAKDLTEKIRLLEQEGIDFHLADIFPWKDALSAGIDAASFNRSFLVQPDLFLRVRPGRTVDMPGMKMIGKDCVVLPNGTKLEEHIVVDKDAVVQDLSSQRIGELLTLIHKEKQEPIHLWDCCCASGGKTILAKDLLPNLNITVSDIRESILINLKNRFQRAGINNYHSFVKDLGSETIAARKPLYDLIICDAPCSGSGTWSRTPEQLFFFDTSAISRYSELQKRIAMNAIGQLKPGGHFLYITCSVFKEENENVVEFLQKNSTLTLVRSESFKGYDQKADTLFAALFSVSAS
jgi:16S rRNA (cytosine967-C5)-methyltransferase